MRCFNVKSCYVVGHLMLVGVLGAPLPTMATDAAPDGVTFAPPPTAVAPSPMQDTAVFSVSAEIQHSGETLQVLPALLAVMRQVAQQPGSGIALHYPEDERGEASAEELRDWLVALGLPSSHIQLIPGSSGDVINISQVAIVQNPVEGKHTLSPVITEPFQIKEATDVVNGVEIP